MHCKVSGVSEDVFPGETVVSAVRGGSQPASQPERGPATGVSPQRQVLRGNINFLPYLLHCVILCVTRGALVTDHLKCLCPFLVAFPRCSIRGVVTAGLRYESCSPSAVIQSSYSRVNKQISSRHFTLP